MTAQKKSLRILIFTHEFFPKKAGVSVFVQEVARAATCAGHLVNVFGPGWAGRTSGKFPYSVTRLSPSIWRLSTIWHLIRSRQICRDAVLYLPEKRALQVMMYLQLLNLVKPASLVATLHGSEIYYFDALPHRRLLFARLLKQVDRITVLSRYCQQLLSERFPVSRDKIRVVPGAVRSDFTPVPRDRGSQAEGLVVLTVGRVHPRKGQMSMLAAIYALEDSLKSTSQSIRVHPLGNGHDEFIVSERQSCEGKLKGLFEQIDS